MKLGTAPEEEPSEPPDGEPDVGDGIRNVQDGDQALSRKQHPLEVWLDMDPKAPLGCHNPLCVSAGPGSTAFVHDRGPDE
jgi:hypothetical protein